MKLGSALCFWLILAAFLSACSSGSTLTPAQVPQTITVTEMDTVKTEKAQPAEATATEEKIETQTSAGTTGCPASSNAPVSESATLVLGPGEGIPVSDAQGERMIMTGTIFDTNCNPVEGASMDVWQTDANGEYGPGHGTDQMECCYLLGTVTTDANGRFQLITVKPGHYKGEQQPPPAHIHAEIRLKDGGQLVTEFVFEGDPYLPSSTEGYTVVSLEEVSDEEGSYLSGTVELRLEP